MMMFGTYRSIPPLERTYVYIDIKQLVLYDHPMTIEERISRIEKNLEGVTSIQEKMMDLLGLTVEGERRLAARAEAHEKAIARIDQSLAEITDKLNGMIGFMDGFIRRA